MQFQLMYIYKKKLNLFFNIAVGSTAFSSYVWDCLMTTAKLKQMQNKFHSFYNIKILYY